MATCRQNHFESLSGIIHITRIQKTQSNDKIIKVLEGFGELKSTEVFRSDSDLNVSARIKYKLKTNAEACYTNLNCNWSDQLECAPAVYKLDNLLDYEAPPSGCDHVSNIRKVQYFDEIKLPALAYDLLFLKTLPRPDFQNKLDTWNKLYSTLSVTYSIHDNLNGAISNVKIRIEGHAVTKLNVGTGNFEPFLSDILLQDLQLRKIKHWFCVKMEECFSRSAETPPRKKIKMRKDPNAPKGPPGAYFAFMKEYRVKMKEENPDLAKNVSEFGKQASAEWKRMSYDKQQEYVDKNTVLIEKWKEEKKNYTPSAEYRQLKYPINMERVRTVIKFFQRFDLRTSG